MTKIRSRSTSRVRDQRGQSSGGGLGDLLKGGLGGGSGLPIPGGGSGGGGGMPIPGGAGCLGSLLKGGGGLTVILLIAAVFILPKLLGGAGANPLSPSEPGAAPAEAPSTDSGGATACESELEQVLCGAVDDTSEYWIDELPASFGVEYVEANTVFFSDAVNTACGRASAQTGPFYCPGDSQVYFDLDFLQTLQQNFGATGDLAAQYIVAHEYGHHVQNVLGINEQVRQAQAQDPGRANQYSIALELQADCFAGAWARDADDRGLLEPGEVEEALNAAAAVGDDRIQERTSGRVDPESWTHGSSAQRVEWFRRGYNTADPQQCSTFSEVL